MRRYPALQLLSRSQLCLHLPQYLTLPLLPQLGTSGVTAVRHRAL